MTDIIQKLCEPLGAEDVELRVGQNTPKGVVLLPYKTARADVKRLNEVFGLNWQNSFYYDDNENLCCNISVYDGDKWIARVDVGTESQTEREKGVYSDSFKRAGFKWGIGVELYRSPFIFIPWDMEASEYSGKKQYKPKNFYQNKLDVIGYETENGVPRMAIAYDGKQIWSNLKGEAAFINAADRNEQYILLSSQIDEARLEKMNNQDYVSALLKQIMRHYRADEQVGNSLIGIINAKFEALGLDKRYNIVNGKLELTYA